MDQFPLSVHLQGSREGLINEPKMTIQSTHFLLPEPCFTSLSESWKRRRPAAPALRPPPPSPRGEPPGQASFQHCQEAFWAMVYNPLGCLLIHQLGREGSNPHCLPALFWAPRSHSGAKTLSHDGLWGQVVTETPSLLRTLSAFSLTRTLRLSLSPLSAVTRAPR